MNQLTDTGQIVSHSEVAGTVCEVMNAMLRNARLAAGLTQQELADQVNAEVRRATKHEGALDGAKVSRLERGVVGLPRRHVVAAFAAVLGLSAAELGWGSRLRASEAVSWAVRRDTCSPEALTAMASVLQATRELEDVTSAATVLPAIDHHVNVALTLVRSARLTDRRDAIEHASGALSYRGWLRQCVGDAHGARADFVAARSAAVEGNHVGALAESLRLEAMADQDDGDYVAAVSRVQAALQYGHDRCYLHTLSARFLAMAGEVSAADHELLNADRVPVTESPGRIYWLTEAFMSTQLGMVFAAQGRKTAAARALMDGLNGMPEAQREAAWMRDCRELRDQMA
jgi:transcriptional regulator with XRE-family HTH domain